jgi:hypothetical protein
VKCTAKKITVKKGVCGSAARRAHSSMPTTDLCSTGLASSVSGTGPWVWTCFGLNGGNSVQCSTKTSDVLMPREENDKYLLLDFWIDEKMRKGIRASVKDQGVNMFMGKNYGPYKNGIGPEKKSDYELMKVVPADGWADAYFYPLSEDDDGAFCFDAWYKIDWVNGKLSTNSQFYSDCIKTSIESFFAPENMSVKVYPVFKGAIVLSSWKDSEEVVDNPDNYSTIIVRNKGVIPIIPEKETTIVNSVLGDCNLDNSCPVHDLVLGNNERRIIAYLEKGKYCYSAWTRYCRGYFCNNSNNSTYWCFEIK